MTMRVLMFAALLLAGCTQPDDAHRILKGMGFTQIAIGGYDFFACGQDDFFSTEFTARNAQGQFVSGTVCSGWFKGSTVRFK